MPNRRTLERTLTQIDGRGYASKVIQGRVWGFRGSVC